MVSRNSRQRVYRLAFYGRSGSGKTCLLAAMAMNRQPHPQGYTCVRLPVENMPRPTGDPSSWESDGEAAAFHHGDDWLNKAIASLNNGDVPPPNDEKQKRMTFQYELTSPDPHPRTYRIELVDYSGELVNPDDLANDKSLASLLKLQLVEMDGLLVLAEAPKPDEPVERLSDELHRLSEAFASLRGDKQQEAAALDAPVALIINKWDRQSEIDSQDPDAEKQKLDDFFGSERSATHKRLSDTLANAVTEGNFRAVPVSAFGEAEKTSTTDGRCYERPKCINPLPSFGLEDGLLWMVQRRDEIDLIDYTAKTKQFLRWFGGGLRGQSVRHGKKLVCRFPKPSAERARAEAALNRDRRTLWGWRSLTVACLLIAVLAAEGNRDSDSYSRLHTMAADPQASVQSVRQFNEWLDHYTSSPWWRHRMYKLRLSPIVAGEELKQLRDERVNKDFKWVQSIADDIDKGNEAELHFKNFPNTPHAQECNRFIAEAKRTREKRENTSWWQRLQQDAKSALETDDEAKLNNVRTMLESAPHPDRESPQEIQNRVALRKQVGDRLTHLVWEKVLVEYNATMKEKRFLDAGNLLSARIEGASADDKLTEVIDNYRSQAREGVSGKIIAFIGARQWDDACDVLVQFQRDMPLWPDSLQFKNYDAFFVAEKNRVQVAQDQHLYESVQRLRTTNAANTYINSAPLKSMKSDVERYKKWLNTQSNPLDLTIVLESIKWGKDAQDANDNHVYVTLNEKQIGNKQDVTSEANTSTGTICSHSFRKKLDDGIKIAVKVIEEDRIFGVNVGDDPHGKCEESVTIRELIGGYTLKLKYGSGYEHEAVFRLTGVPDEPTLPDWRND